MPDSATTSTCGLGRHRPADPDTPPLTTTNYSFSSIYGMRRLVRTLVFDDLVVDAGAIVLKATSHKTGSPFRSGPLLNHLKVFARKSIPSMITRSLENKFPPSRTEAYDCVRSVVSLAAVCIRQKLQVVRRRRVRRHGPARLGKRNWNPQHMTIRRFSSRLALIFVVLFAVAQAVILIMVDRVGSRITREHNVEQLRIGERLFGRLLDQNRLRLLQAAEVLSRDFAFREAIATGDAPTISSVLNNHGRRIRADVMALVSTDHHLIADSVNAQSTKRPFANLDLIRTAEQNGRAWGVMVLDGNLHQVVVVPVLAPDPIAWVVLGFSIDARFVEDLSAITALQVSFVKPNDSGWSVLATSGPRQEFEALFASLPRTTERSTEPLRLGTYDTVITSVDQDSAQSVSVVLQRSVAQGIETIERFKSWLWLLTCVGIAAFIVVSILVARRITRPLAALNQFASHVRDGNYGNRLSAAAPDEFGALSVSFNHMLDRIESRQAEILRLAFQDSVTNIPNRAYFISRLKEAVDSYRSNALPFAVLLIDLDRFKFINDTLGHPAGDLTLTEVGKRIRECLPENVTVARLGGDEFAILLSGHDSADSAAVASKVHLALEEPIDLYGQGVDVRGSIGIAHCPAHGVEPGILLQRADIAMYVAKRDKAGVAVFHESYDQHRAAHLSMLSDLKRAIAENQLVLHYQPKLDLRKDVVTDVEALVRWKHPMHGMVAPTEFVSFAEQTGMIRHLTRWVIECATQQCHEWLSRGIRLGISMNVSSQDLLDDELPTSFESATRRYGVPPDLITIEVTESAFLHDPQRASATINALKRHGFKLSVDDYGTGYSSLAYVQQLQCDELKIDRSFVTHVSEKGKDMAIVRSTIDLAHSLGLIVVAEGVETEATLDVLRGLGCDLIQGYVLARPMDAQSLCDWLSTNALVENRASKVRSELLDYVMPS